VPRIPFAWESPRLELTFSTRVPIRNATEDWSVWERMVGRIRAFLQPSPSAFHGLRF
jgi:hypothetical protein